MTIMRDGRTVRVADMAGISKFELVSTMLGRDVVRAESRTTGFGLPGRPVGPPVLAAQSLSDGGPVRDVALNVAEGEIVGLAGLLGAGRSETARLVFGDARMKGGAMQLGGADYVPREPADAIRAGLGFCTEDRKIEGIIPDMR